MRTPSPCSGLTSGLPRQQHQQEIIIITLLTGRVSPWRRGRVVQCRAASQNPTLTPWECRYSTVLQIVCRTELASLSEKNFCRRILSSSSPPLISSVTRYTYFPSSYTYQSKQGGVNPTGHPELPFCTPTATNQPQTSHAEVGLGMLPHPRAIR